jgi:hypothetical protein
MVPVNPPQVSCAAQTCAHMQQYWPVWVCTISAGGALVAKGYFGRWDVAGGFVGAGIIVSLAIACFRRPDRPLTPNTIREHRENLEQNRQALHGAVENQQQINRQLAEAARALEEGRGLVQDNIERQGSGDRYLREIVEEERRNLERLAKINADQQNVQGEVDKLNYSGESDILALEGVSNALASTIRRSQTIMMQRHSQIHPLRVKQDSTYEDE